ICSPQMAGSQDLSPWYELMGCVAGFWRRDGLCSWLWRRNIICSPQMAGSQDLSPWYELMGCVAGFGEEILFAHSE
ncbi:MAG: hypothetical protein NZ772_16175, partial [Cyanobacteria bacterium]|nr:hypothetical protein [Cyanobacteriota bacterium]